MIAQLNSRPDNPGFRRPDFPVPDVNSFNGPYKQSTAMAVRPYGDSILSGDS
jgi:hypothetical protein